MFVVQRRRTCLISLSLVSLQKLRSAVMAVIVPQDVCHIPATPGSCKNETVRILRRHMGDVFFWAARSFKPDAASHPCPVLFPTGQTQYNRSSQVNRHCAQSPRSTHTVAIHPIRTPVQARLNVTDSHSRIPNTQHDLCGSRSAPYYTTE